MNSKIPSFLSLLFLLLLLSSSSKSQVAMGQWRDHLPYNEAIAVAVTPQKVYCATPVSMFSYDKSDNSLERLSKITGFSDMGVSALSYSAEYDILIVGYQNGNIDILKDDQIINMADISRKQIIGSKRINNIMLIDKYAYLSCSFGIVVINLEKIEIADTYVIGARGTMINVNKMTYDGTSLWAATDEGLFYADINSSNLLDYNNWTHVEDIPYAYNKFTNVEWFNNNIYAVYHNGAIPNIDKVYEYNGSGWSQVFQEYDIVKSINATGDKLVFCNEYYVDVVDKNMAVERHIYDYGDSKSPRGQTAIFDTDNKTLWIADRQHGLSKNTDAWNSEVIYPDGPAYSSAVDVSIEGGNVWVASGGLWSLRGIYALIDEEWVSYNTTTIEGMDGFKETVRVKADSENPSRVFLGSRGSGLIEMINGEVVNRYNHENSLLTLLTADLTTPIRIGGLDFDSEGSLWMTNEAVANPVLRLTANGEWDNFEDLKLNDYVGVAPVYDLFVTSYDHKWVIPRGNGITIIGNTENAEVDKIVIKDNEGTVATQQIYAVAEDMNGYMWVGTDKGVYVYYHPENVFSGENFYATQPCVDENDGICHPLLGSERVTAIAIDGANRKWFGTRSNGIYLISEDGTEELRNFNVENSPLLSNSILSIDINHENGEVFFATENGLISYKGEATEGGAYFGDVYAYPNPVRPEYDGMITITGLARDVNVKITDITGVLVSESTAFGGQAVWNGRTLSGRKVQSGVYLVHCTNEDGSQTYVTKILFVN